jgi:hypothetical protein
MRQSKGAYTSVGLQHPNLLTISVKLSPKYVKIYGLNIPRNSIKVCRLHYALVGTAALRFEHKIYQDISPPGNFKILAVNIQFSCSLKLSL